MPEAVQVFVAPPRRRRCGAPRGPGTDTPEEIERRLAVAREELDAQREFAHVIVNDDVERARGRAGASWCAANLARTT